MKVVRHQPVNGIASRGFDSRRLHQHHIRRDSRRTDKILTIGDLPLLHWGLRPAPVLSQHGRLFIVTQSSFRASVLFVILGQIATLVAAPLAVCYLADTGSPPVHECPHQMEPGAYCPMHHGNEDGPSADPVATWQTCGVDHQLLAWLHVPLAPPEPVTSDIGIPLDCTPTPIAASLTPAQPMADPPSPPPRAS